MNLADDILGQLKDAPHWLIVLVGITLFGLWWKKSRLPNRWLPVLNLLLPAVVYPVLHYSPEADHLYWNPWAMLALHGVGIGLAGEFCHEGIVAKLKSVFPGLNFPDGSKPADEKPVPPP